MWNQCDYSHYTGNLSTVLMNPTQSTISINLQNSAEISFTDNTQSGVSWIPDAASDLSASSNVLLAAAALRGAAWESGFIGVLVSSGAHCSSTSKQQHRVVPLTDLIHTAPTTRRAMAYYTVSDHTLYDNGNKLLCRILSSVGILFQEYIAVTEKALSPIF